MLPHALRFIEPAGAPAPVDDHGFALTYGRTMEDARDVPRGGVLAHAPEHVPASSPWRYHEIATNHMVASDRAEEAIGASPMS